MSLRSEILPFRVYITVSRNEFSVPQLGKDLPCGHHDSEDSEANSEARRVLDRAFGRHHQLRYAQIWAVHLDKRCTKVIGKVYDDDDDDDYDGDDDVHDYEDLLSWLKGCEGNGVLEKAISSKGAYFCEDVSNLSINVLPWVPLAREFGLSGSFAICLRSSRVNDAIYILELFFYSEIDFGDTETFLRNLVLELKKNIEKTEDSPFQKIEERLSVEIIKISPEQDEIDSFKICTTDSSPLIFDHLGQGVMMPHELSMEMEANEESFSSGDEICNFMPYKLSYSPPADEDETDMHVFWSSEDNELQSILRFSYPSLYAFPISQDETIKEKIKLLLQRLQYDCDYLYNFLVQSWAPVKVADKVYLTCADQPFALAELVKGLFSYRRLCLHPKNILIPVGHVRKSGSEEHRLGPLGRAFRHHRPEFCSDIRCYLIEEYPQRHNALQLGIQNYVALPLIQSIDLHCIGVLEVISTSRDTFPFLYLPYLKTKLEALDLKTQADPILHDIFSCLDSEAAGKARRIIYHTLRSYHQPLCAHMWAARLDKTCISFIHGNYYEEEVTRSGLKKGQGVVGKAFSSLGACFCKDITKLSIDVFPWVPLARRLRLSGCFAICLKSSRFDEVYILEFLFGSRIDYGDPKTFLAKLVVGLKKKIEKLENSPIRAIEEKLFVEVIKVSSNQNELESFEICTTRSPPTLFDHPQHDEMMQHDSSPLQVDETNDARPNIDCAMQTDVVRSNQEGRLTELGGARNKGTAICTLDVAYGITREVLEQHSEKKLLDAAKTLGVSRSTLKRICRKHGIGRWPRKRSKGLNDSSIHQDSVHSAANENTNAQNIPNSRTVEDGGSIMVKAAYGEDILKFQLSLSARKTDLEQQVAERLNPSVGSFRIKYLDEENEWVLVACDKDLKLCIDTCKLLGKTTIRMSVN